MPAPLRLLALLLVVGGVSSCSPTRSTIGIPAGETFVLGGGQAGAFEAKLLNIGSVSVRVAELTLAGDTVSVSELGPGDDASVRFSAGSAALLINTADREASVQGVIQGNTDDLGMRYVTPDGAAAPRDEIKTNLTIPSGEMFVLGGGQTGAFSAFLRNDGRVGIEIAEVTAAGDTVRVGTLLPDAVTTARFAAGSAALLRNPGGSRAQVWAEVTGDTGLGMRYAPTN